MIFVAQPQMHFFFFFLSAEGVRCQIIELWFSLWGGAGARHPCPRGATPAHASPGPGVCTCKCLPSVGAGLD